MAEWLNTNKLSINTSKTTFLLFRSFTVIRALKHFVIRGTANP